MDSLCVAPGTQIVVSASPQLIATFAPEFFGEMEFREARKNFGLGDVAGTELAHDASHC
jgi:hypothetical protein